MLRDKDQELVAIGASIASGRQPCTKYHFRAARIAGANDEEIDQAVIEALDVRRHATEVVARIGGTYLDDAADLNTRGTEGRSLIGELVSVSTAFAINCVTSLETHLTSGRQKGATDDEILTALRIACAVKDVARNKVQVAAEKLFGASANHGDECSCQNDADPSSKKMTGVAASQSCSCQN